MSPRHPREKVLSQEDALGRYGRPRDFRLVFTNGCFDLLHWGHVECLHAARGLGAALVVGVNSDHSVRRLKGPGRPLVPEQERALLLASLAAVDGVVLFDQDTPRELIAALLPDVLVKGGDYLPQEVAGADEVERAGGEVVIVPLVPGASTSSLIGRLSAPP
ncbi:MAG: D-glycero-beta-D-manno-heptose 1-phosphate adenylyltransferase [Longimicrobiaceae bacterium]